MRVMLKLYHAPRTRSVRIVWLLEELGLPYELVRVEFKPTSDRFFQQDTPLGKIPVLEDGDVVMCESGAITQYILERYGNGRLEPAVGSPRRAAFLQWLHFAEATAFPPLGVVVWISRYRDNPAEQASLLPDARARALTGLQFLEDNLAGKQWILGDEFSAADIMLGFTLAGAQAVGVLDESLPECAAYLGRLMQREAFRKAATA
jgi:glutathione S-transferase